jgi:hypothetical protein
MKTNYVLVAFCLLALAGGCSEDNKQNPAAPQNQPDLIPLYVQKQWIYDVVNYQNDSLIYQAQDTVSVDTSSLVWGGSFWYRFAGREEQYRWRNGVDGIWRLRLDLRYPEGYAERYYGFPARAGETWRIRSEDDSVRLVSTSYQVTPPAGTFDNCYYFSLKRDDGSRLASVWIKPGIGIVQESVLTIAGNDTSLYQSWLRSY